MIIRSIGAHLMPFATLPDSLVFTAWALVLIFIVIERKYKVTALGVFANLMALVTVGVVWMLPKGVSPNSPVVLQSHWSGIHIASCLVAFSSFVLAFGAALGYIIQEQMLKTKKINALQRHLPSLDAADRLSYRMVAFGFPMLTLGIVTGALWAQSAWGSYWNWDPKETWSFATWLVYAAYLHERIMVGRRGKWPNRLLVAGFCCILITFVGVNFLPTGLHKY